MYKIKFDRNKCIGCGACVSISNNWKMVNDKAQPIKKVLTDLGTNADAKDSCPVGAIKISG